MKLFFALGEHPDHGGRYEATIVAETLEEARAVLAEYKGGEYSDVEFTIHGKGKPIPDKAAVLSVSESGV